MLFDGIKTLTCVSVLIFDLPEQQNHYALRPPSPSSPGLGGFDFRGRISRYKRFYCVVSRTARSEAPKIGGEALTKNNKVLFMYRYQYMDMERTDMFVGLSKRKEEEGGERP